jgi:hypothetical protein
VGRHSRETLTHEEEAHERLLASGRRPSAAEREMLYHTLTSHRMKLFAQASEMTVRLGDLLAEVQRLDRQLADMERSAFWRTGAD